MEEKAFVQMLTSCREFKEALLEQRKEQLETVHISLRKYIDVLPAYMVSVVRTERGESLMCLVLHGTSSDRGPDLSS